MNMTNSLPMGQPTLHHVLGNTPVREIKIVVITNSNNFNKNNFIFLRLSLYLFSRFPRWPDFSRQTFWTLKNKFQLFFQQKPLYFTGNRADKINVLSQSRSMFNNVQALRQRKKPDFIYLNLVQTQILSKSLIKIVQSVTQNLLKPSALCLYCGQRPLEHWFIGYFIPHKIYFKKTSSYICLATQLRSGKGSIKAPGILNMHCHSEGCCQLHFKKLESRYGDANGNLNYRQELLCVQ